MNGLKWRWRYLKRMFRHQADESLRETLKSQLDQMNDEQLRQVEHAARKLVVAQFVDDVRALVSGKPPQGRDVNTR